MNIILNEKKYVEDLIVNPAKENVTSQNVWLVAKYYSELGYNKAKTTDMVEHFLLRNDPRCNLVTMSNMIDHAVKNAGKKKLLQIESIPVTFAEMDVVDGLSALVDRKVLFTLICLAKLSNEITGTESCWVNHSVREIFELANAYSMTNQKRNMLIHKLYKQGLVAFSKRIDNTNIQVKCINYNSDACLQVSDYRNLGNQYLRYKGGPYFECEECGLVVKRNSSRQLYCDNCRPNVKRKSDRDRKRMS